MIKNNPRLKKHLKIIKSLISGQINKLIIVLIILLIIFTMKIINHPKSNQVIYLLKENIDHKFSLKNDSEKVIEVFQDLKESIKNR